MSAGRSSRIGRRIVGGAPFFPLFVLFGLNAVDELDRAAFAVLIPNIRDHFDLDLETVLGLVGLVGVVSLLLQIPIAYWADRGSRVRIATVSAALLAVFSIGTGLAPVIAFLAVARMGSTVALASNTPTHNSLLADYYGLDVRGKVYGFHRSANAVGQFLGPLLGGVIAYFFGWRTPFVLFAVPTLIFVALSLRLREPRRGMFEREAVGGAEALLETDEEPPSFAESWRLVWQIRSLRRMWYSLPFLAASLIGLSVLLSVYYEEIFGLNEAQRGAAFAAAEPAQMLGLLIGVPYFNKLLSKDPGRALRFIGVMGCIASVVWIGLVVAPSLPFAIAAHLGISALMAVIGPGILAGQALAIPPRARAMGFSVGSLWVIPGLLVLATIGAIGDSVGLRPAMFVMVPIFVVGAVILASCGPFIAEDARRIQMAALARAEVLHERRAGRSKLLVVRGLDVSYGGTQVLFGVDFEVDEGEVVALLGTNGAGKSTLLRAMSGLVEPHGGAVIFDGHDTTFVPAEEVVARGIVHVPGGRGVFPTLTVGENFRAAQWKVDDDPAAIEGRLREALAFFPVLRNRWDQPAGNLSGGEQQMLTLSMAFIAQPRLLMIDELSLGLAPAVVEQLLGIVRALAARGTTVILVEQSVNVALTLAETAYFMEKGEIRFHGPTSELLDRPDILRSVFLEGSAAVASGGSPAAPKPSALPAEARARRTADAPSDAPPALAVAGLMKRFGGVAAVQGASLSVAPGAILGIIGPNGAGKTTVFDLVSGFVVADEGRVSIGGRDVTALGPHERARAGLGRSFQDGRLFGALTVAETVSVAFERHLEDGDPVAAALGSPATRRSERHVREQVDGLIELLGLQAFANKFVAELSTGSRRIVDLACVLAHKPTVLLLDEPSSGIAQRETEAMGPLLTGIRDATGAGLVVIEHDMPLITAISDRMIALETGRVIAEGAPEDVIADPEVVRSYLGNTEAVIHRSGGMPGGGRKRRARPVGAAR